MDFYFGGYFLVKGAKPKEYMAKELLPKQLYSLTSCICSLYPHLDLMTWALTCDEEKKAVQEDLGMSAEVLKNFQKESDLLFHENKWNQCFYDLTTAKTFAKKHLSHLKSMKLLGIALSEEHRKQYLAEESEEEPSGMYLTLQKEEKAEIKEGFLGYEVLGSDLGIFHSFLCNSLETDYVKQLKIPLNKNGLIDEYDAACKAAVYTGDPEIGAEPVLWLPWAIMEYPL